jgi:hypothetical protein
MYDAMYGTWNDVADPPADVFRRSFRFCAIDDPSSYRQLDVIGAGNVMVESDYPHADSTWPNTQAMLREHLADLDNDAIERVTWRNASELFRHDVPDAVQHDPDAF